MVLDKKDVDVSMQIHKEGWYVDEKFDIEVFQQNLKSGMTLVDLGANVGFYTILGRSIVGKTGRVYAFEPFPRNAELIKASVKENSFENVSVVQAAVSDRNGNRILHLSPDANSEHSLLDLDFHYGKVNATVKEKSINVNVRRLDDYFKNEVHDLKVDFIKMDIEGSEYRAFEGMQEILKSNRKIVLMTEFWPNGFRKDNRDPYEFLERIITTGFRINIIDNLSQKAYGISPEELKRLEKKRCMNAQAQNDVMRVWGWYTNLICMKN